MCFIRVIKNYFMWKCFLLASRLAVPICNKLLTLMCYCTEWTNLLDQVCSTFQFGVTWATWIDSIFFPLSLGHHYTVLFTRLNSRKVSAWHWKQSPCNHEICALLWPTRWPSLSGSVSRNHRKWAYTVWKAGKKTHLQNKNLSPQHLLH